MKIPYILLLISALLCLAPSCQGRNVADMIIYSDEIYTANSNGDIVQAFAVKNGKYIAVGTKNDVDKVKGDNTVIYNPAFAMPGAIESHGHWILEQAFKLGCYIKPVKDDEAKTPKTFEEIANEVKDYRDKHPDLKGIYGYGWDFAKQLGADPAPDLSILDALFPEIPVFLSEASLHGAWLNSKCFEKAGIDPNSGDNDPEGVIIDRDEDGKVLSIARDETCTYLRNRVFSELLPPDQYKEAVKKAARELNKNGYTAHYDMWSNFDGTDKMYDAIASAEEDGDLNFLYSTAYCVESFEKDEASQFIDKAVELKKKYLSPHFKPNYLKMFADGVCETYTGYCSKPYVGGGAPYYGTRIWTPAEMTNIVLEANRKGLDVHIHTMGDAAVHEAVQSFISSSEVNGYHRNSIGHVALINQDDLYDIKKYNLAVSSGAYWASQTTEDELKHFHDYVFDDDRFRELYPYKDYIDFGIKAALHTDNPCTPARLDLFGYIQILVNGIDHDKSIEGTVLKRDRGFISVKDAIDMYTINGAWMNNLENERGSIEVGKYADFIFADKNPLQVKKDDVWTAKIDKTFFEGKQVYQREQE